MRKAHKSFAEAYKEGLAKCLYTGDYVKGVLDQNSVGSKFGTEIRATNELLGFQFIVENPRNRSINSKFRNPNKAYQLANFLWTLTGDANANQLIKFNLRGEQFTDTDGNLHSAIGPHLFKLKFDEFHEFDSLIKLIKMDNSTRRAVIQLFQKKDLSLNIRDIPCYNHLQFFLRNNHLHCVAVMRSQSALMVLPYDFFLFSMIHETIAVRLNVELGHLHYVANSFHIYEDEFDLAERVINSDIEENPDDPMKSFDSDTIRNLCKVFDDISNDHPVNDSVLDPYWSKMIHKYFEKEFEIA